MSDSTPTTHGSTLKEWMEGLAESTGSPGGGAAAGVMFAIAASLTSMVAGYTEPPAELEAELAAVRKRAGRRRDLALRLADDDAAASKAFGCAFRLEKGPDREQAIGAASVEAARASAELGRRAAEAIEDLEWLASHGNPSLISDVTVACGALRSALAGARTNVSFDLASLTSAGTSLAQVKEQESALWSSVQQFDAALARIDLLTAGIDHRAAPTD